MCKVQLLSFLVVAILSLIDTGYCANCKPTELLTIGKKIRDEAQSMCKSGEAVAKFEKIRKCAELEINRATGPFKPFIEAGLGCMHKKHYEDPCNKANVEEIKNCGKEKMKTHPDLKESKAMQMASKHCVEIRKHMLDFAKCSGHPV